RQREVARQIRIRDEITADVIKQALNETGSIRGAARLTGCDRSVFRRFPDVIEMHRRTPGRNRKVQAHREWAGDQEVVAREVPRGCASCGGADESARPAFVTGPKTTGELSHRADATRRARSEFPDFFMQPPPRAGQKNVG